MANTLQRVVPSICFLSPSEESDVYCFKLEWGGLISLDGKEVSQFLIDGGESNRSSISLPTAPVAVDVSEHGCESNSSSCCSSPSLWQGHRVSIIVSMLSFSHISLPLQDLSWWSSAGFTWVNTGTSSPFLWAPVLMMSIVATFRQEHAIEIVRFFELPHHILRRLAWERGRLCVDSYMLIRGILLSSS